MSSLDDICRAVERIGHCRAHIEERLGPHDEREWRWELRDAQGKLRSAIDRRADTLASYISMPVGLLVLVGLLYLNPQLLEEGVTLTWEILAGVAAGTVVHLWLRKFYRNRLQRRLGSHLVSA